MKPSFIGSMASRIRRLPSALTTGDRIIIVGALAMLIIGIIGAQKNVVHGPTKDIPVRGGQLVEGIIASSSADVDAQLTNLTNIGLVRFDDKLSIQPALADSYSISQDGLVYTFKLHEGLSEQEIVDTLKNPSSNLGNIQVTLDNNHNLSIKLNTPYAPLLGNMTEPFFPYGPYSISKRTNKEVDLSSRRDFVLGEPFIPSIILKIYPDDSALNRALDRGEVLAGSGINNTISGYSQYTLHLQKKTLLFFNLDRDPGKNTDLRQKLAQGKSIGETISLSITTTHDKYFIDQLNKLKDKFAPLGVTVQANIVDDTTMRAKIIPNRDFDALIYGIDYGRDPDLYPFWHSSQIGGSGKNLSGFKNKDVDGLLEQALLTTNLQDRQKKYADALKIIDDQAPVIELDNISLPYLVSKKVQSIQIDQGVVNGDRYTNIWQWYMRTKKVPA